MLKFPVVALSCATFAAQAAETFGVPAELWDRPRSGQAVLAQPAVKQAVKAHLARPSSSLVIRHAAGQEGTLQAEELRAWLIALAIPSGRVRLSGTLNPGEPLMIEISP